MRRSPIPNLAVALALAVAGCSGGGDGGSTVTTPSRSLTVSRSGDGAGTVTSDPGAISCGAACVASFAEGASVTLTAAPDADSVFAGWSGGGCTGTGACVVALAADTAVTATFAAKARVTVTLVGAGSGSVDSTPAGLSCTGATCTGRFAPGATVSLAATPGAASAFGGWGGACSGTSAACVLTVGSDLAVSATFVPLRILTVAAAGAGAGTVTSAPGSISCPGGTCSGTFVDGTQVTLTPAADDGSVFAGWSGACAGTAACTVALDQDRSVTATFVPLRTLLVALAGAGGGAVTSTPGTIACGASCSATFPDGSAVTLTATPDASSVFAGWTGAGCSGAGTCVVTLGASAQVTATFAKKVSVTVTLLGAGSGSVDSTPAGLTCAAGTCTARFAPGATILVAATPGAASAFAGWDGACTGGGGCEVTLDGDATLTATFVPLRTLTVSVEGAGEVRSSPAGIACPDGGCDAQLVDGQAVVLTASATAGNLFAGWGGACTGVGATCAVMLDSDLAVTARFVPLRTLTVGLDGAGSGLVTSRPAAISCPGACSGEFADGTTIELTAEPSATSAFAGWSGGCTGSVATCTVTVDSDAAVGATFAATHALTASVAGSGTLTTSPSGLSCTNAGGAGCTSRYLEGTPVTVAATPDLGWRFTGFDGACAGTGACVVDMSAARSVSASFSGPFDFSIAHSAGSAPLSLVAGDVRTVQVAIALTGGAGIPVALSAMVPPGVTAAFAPAEVVPPATSVLTLSVPASHSGTVSGGASIKGTSALGARYAFLPLEIRSPYRLTSPQDVVLEEGGLTALATEHDRVVRLDTLTGKVTRTIASGLAAGSEEPQQLVVEPGGATALVAAPGALRRVELATGELTDVATGLSQPHGVALESATHALVTDCGTSCATDGRVLRVDLGSGAVTEVATGLSRPRGIALESATHALVALTGSRQLVRVDLGSGATVPVAVDLPGDAQPFGAPSLTGPTDVAVEAGGRTALVLTSWLQAVVRVDLAVGTKTTVRSTGFSGYASGIAVEADGDSALLAESDRILRVPLDVPDHTVATARLSPDALYDARGVAPVSGSDDLLVTNVAPSLEGQLLRVDRATGVATRIPLVDGGATPVTLNSPQALALDRAGEVLVMEHDRISRVALASGLRTEVLPLPSWPNPIVGKGLAVVPQSFAVFTTDRNQEVRFLNLLENPPIATTLRSIPGVACCSGGVALPPGGGEFAYALRYAPTGGSGVLERISLMEGGAFRVADGFATPTGIAIEGDTHALVVESGAGGRVVRVDLVTGRRTIVAGALGAPRFLALEAGAALVAEGSRIARVATEGLALGPTFVATLNDPRAFVVEAGGATALVVDCQDGVACSSGGRLVRVDLQTGARTQLATAFNDPAGVALLDASTAIVTDCGPVGTYNCNANGRVLRVALGTGAVSQIVDGLNEPVGVAAEPGGTVLVAERGGGRVMRVWPSNGARQQVVSGLHGPDRIAVESGGASALVLEYSGISRVNIAARTAVKLASWQWGPFHGGGAFALEPDGERVLVIPGNGAGPTHPVPLGRVDLATGAHAVLSPGAFDSVRDLAVLDETQAIALERRVGSGALVRFTR